MKICIKCHIDKNDDDFFKNMRLCKICFREHMKDYHKKWRESNPEKVKKYHKNWYENNKEHSKNIRNRYIELCSDRLKKTWKDYRDKNREKLNVKRKEYIKKNRIKLNEYAVNKRKSNPLLKMSHNIRGRIRQFLSVNNLSKNNKTFDIVGCTPQELKVYLEVQFNNGMSWENYGYYGWHIDHIIPLDYGKNEKEIYDLCHYSNLQPLWYNDNLHKSNKIK